MLHDFDCTWVQRGNGCDCGIGELHERIAKLELNLTVAREFLGAIIGQANGCLAQIPASKPRLSTGEIVCIGRLGATSD